MNMLRNLKDAQHLLWQVRALRYDDEQLRKVQQILTHTTDQVYSLIRELSGVGKNNAQQVVRRALIVLADETPLDDMASVRHR